MTALLQNDASTGPQGFHAIGSLAFGFIVLAGWTASMLGILYVTMAVAPNLTHRSAAALRERNFRSFFAGAGVTGLFFVLVLLTAKAGGAQFVVMVLYGALLVPGLAAGAEDLGRRLFWASGKEGSRAAHLAAGWTVYVFGSAFPVIGWFVVGPYVALSGVGSLVVGAFGGARPKEIEFPKE